MIQNLKFIALILAVIAFFFFVPSFVLELANNIYQILLTVISSMTLFIFSIAFLIKAYEELKCTLFD